MNRHLVIFAKAPRVGLVKSRLAAGIGMTKAWSFYRRSLQHVIRPLANDPRWTTWLALSPHGHIPLPEVNVPPSQRFSQVSGGLGERMGHAMHTFAPHPVLIIGTDVPDISPRHIESAFTALRHHKFVFGPAGDGGYWLVGQRGNSRPRDIFSNVRWSSQHTLADTCRNIPDQSNIALLDTLLDIDDLDSLDEWQHMQNNKKGART